VDLCGDFLHCPTTQLAIIGHDVGEVAELVGLSRPISAIPLDIFLFCIAWNTGLGLGIHLRHSLLVCILKWNSIGLLRPSYNRTICPEHVTFPMQYSLRAGASTTAPADSDIVTLEGCRRDAIPSSYVSV
jgi:hypothetical protein